MVRTYRPKPVTEQDLNRAVAEVQHFYASQDTAIEHVREVVELRSTVAVDDKYKSTSFVARDPTATDHVVTTGTMLTVNRPQLQLKYEGKGDAKQKLVARLEPALESLILDDAGKDGATYTRVGMALAQDGGAWSSLVADLDAWKGPGQRYAIKRKDYEDDEGYPTASGSKSADDKYLDATDKAKRKAHRCVLRWDYRDAKTVYPVWLNDDELGAMFVVTEHPKWTTLSEYGLTTDYEGNLVDIAVGQPMPENEPRPVGEKIKKIEHWTANDVNYFVVGAKKDGQPSVRKVLSINHRYGFVPFAWSFGWRLPHWNNIKVGWGAAGIMLQSVEYLSFLKTLHANEAVRSLVGSYKRIIPAGGDPVRDPRTGNPVPVTQMVPQAILNLQPGEDIQPIDQVQPNPHLREQIAMEREAVMTMRGPVAAGNISDAENGFAIESVKSDRKVKNSPFIDGLSKHLKDVTTMAMRLVRGKIKETVWVKGGGRTEAAWLSIKVDDLDDEPLVRWDISPEQPSGAIVEGRYYGEQQAAGFIGPSEAIEKQGRNPADVFADILEGQMRQDPLYVELAKQEMVAEFSRGDLLRRFQEAKQAFLSGTVQPQGGPEMGGAMGAGGVPGDFGALAMAPGGAGANPIPMAQAGVPTGGGFSPQGATAMVQDLG